LSEQALLWLPSAVVRSLGRIGLCVSVGEVNVKVP
jgi:hypothetical protein